MYCGGLGLGVWGGAGPSLMTGLPRGGAYLMGGWGCYGLLPPCLPIWAQTNTALLASEPLPNKITAHKLSPPRPPDFAGKQPPALFVLDTGSWEVAAVQGLPEGASCGQPVWSPEGALGVLRCRRGAAPAAVLCLGPVGRLCLALVCKQRAAVPAASHSA